ncbi:ATP-binding protein [Lysobacter capsici]|uniref:ATP-binding protein n=1 Tax=Lysobacter capsici TaxID=435897 RepID=UPI00287BA0FA|nr:ATP-binding protein [Lysobacter capsici]WND81307.1 ATP-binding protein [Lysobacter capsici]WND86503.1 ATP-binding protein [Lysobacter capsici]
MKIKAVKFSANTEEGAFGFFFEFSDGLTIVRGGNSSGKSTFFNCLLYGLGMEELIGGRCERALPYAVKDYFVYDERQIRIQSSEVFLEVENKSGRVMTFRRPIRDSLRDQRLVEVYQAAIREIDSSMVPFSLYLHDAGAAKYEEGFYKFLEDFLAISLPKVPTTSGGETKLYLQEVFSAFAVEQKRGWTDYIANIPFFGIRDPRIRVVEYLLDLAVFEVNSIRNRLNSESIAIDLEWGRLFEALRGGAASLGFAVEGVPRKPKADFDLNKVRLYSHSIEGEPSLPEYISLLREEYQGLNAPGRETSKESSELLARIEGKRDELLQTTSRYDHALADLEMSRASAHDFESLLDDAKSDLIKNKTAKKLRDLGARNSLSIAVNECPTCHQSVAESLLPESVAGQQMGLSANIEYLESQCRMLDRQLSGTKSTVAQGELRVTDLSTRMTARHKELVALRSEFSAGELQTKAQLRRQVRIEIEVNDLESFQITHEKILKDLAAESLRLKLNQEARLNLPAHRYTDADSAQIELFEKNFRANAGSFDYTSAKIGDIEISKNSLTPFLAQLELREIRTDIKSDSSASDFVRLIWSYLVALYQVGTYGECRGNHIGLLMFDEPGQHSMAEDSQRALLASLSAEPGLQSIVAASFDESDSVFNNATDGIRHSLISWDGKLIKPM